MHLLTSGFDAFDLPTDERMAHRGIDVAQIGEAHAHSASGCFDARTIAVPRRMKDLLWEEPALRRRSGRQMWPPAIALATRCGLLRALSLLRRFSTCRSMVRGAIPSSWAHCFDERPRAMH